MKRIVTLQDISCVGRCSLTVALPIISSMGIETAVLPTAVLSTHTAFEGFTFRDLTSDIKPTAEHWKKLGLDFSAIYTGYMGSKEQIDIVAEFFDEFRTADNIIIVDPAMADNGILYAGFPDDFADSMVKLVSKADIIIPNMTEAALLLGIDYPEDGYDEGYVRDMLKGLTGLGCRCAVITGVSFKKDRLGAAVYDASKDSYFGYYNKKCEQNYHGTGDIFASVLTGAVVNGKSMADAVKTAVDFTLASIEYTEKDENARWYGVDFEKALPLLIS